MAMEGYRPAFNGDAAFADAELADDALEDAAPADTEPAEAKPSDTAQMPTPLQVTCFDPAQFPMSEPYSLDGITAIPALVFRRSTDPG
jgi:hypothetical protein